MKVKVDLTFAHIIGEIAVNPQLKAETIEVDVQCELGRSLVREKSDSEGELDFQDPSSPIFDAKSLMDH